MEFTDWMLIKFGVMCVIAVLVGLWEGFTGS